MGTGEKIQTFLDLFRSNRGFTLLELVLSLVVSGVVLGIVTETLMREAETYSFIANRKGAVADVRYALNRMTRELLRLDTPDIRDISATKIEFSDENGNVVSFGLAAAGQDLAVFRGGEVLVPRIRDFNIEYRDESGNLLSPDPGQIPFVRRIRLTIETDPVSDEGQIVLSTTVVPRAFLGYLDYQ